MKNSMNFQCQSLSSACQVNKSTNLSEKFHVQLDKIEKAFNFDWEKEGAHCKCKFMAQNLLFHSWERWFASLHASSEWIYVFRGIVFDRFSHLGSASSWLFVLVADWFEIHPIDTNILYRRCTELYSERKAADLLQWHFIDISLHFWHNLHKSMCISNSFPTLLIILNSGRLLQHTKHFHNLTLHLICYFNCCHLSAKKAKGKAKIQAVLTRNSVQCEF